MAILKGPELSSRFSRLLSFYSPWLTNYLQSNSLSYDYLLNFGFGLWYLNPLQNKHSKSVDQTKESDKRKKESIKAYLYALEREKEGRRKALFLGLVLSLFSSTCLSFFLSRRVRVRVREGLDLDLAGKRKFSSFSFSKTMKNQIKSL